jgi:hypothetical protein
MTPSIATKFQYINSSIGNTPTTKKGIIPPKRLRKGRHIITAYVKQAIITGERQKPPLPTARSPRRLWISRPKNLEDHPDHHEEIQICHIKSVHSS